MASLFLSAFFFILWLTTTTVITTQATLCGKTRGTVGNRILNGNTARSGSWPWMVSINTLKSSVIENVTGRLMFVCGGSIVGREWVLTAAHCLDSRKFPNFFHKSPQKHWRVTAGMQNRNLHSSETLNWQQRGVRFYAWHPFFRERDGVIHNDIAIIRVDKKFTYNEWVRPICLPTNYLPKPARTPCKAAGWGTVTATSKFYAMRLQEVQIPIIDFATCMLRYGNDINAINHICGGYWYYGKKDTCWGDSGGPLACQNPYGTWYLAGIISWGIGCGLTNRPGVYTNVNSYANWIRHVVANESRNV